MSTVIITIRLYG